MYLDGPELEKYEQTYSQLHAQKKPVPKAWLISGVTAFPPKKMKVWQVLLIWLALSAVGWVVLMGLVIGMLILVGAW